ncbi:calmodulin-binding transcription activator 1-like [Coffea eugenioides]|uniref:calmodulin-binding transcription activator 1-like n=1 Tax=Coffea eugenioides TaxID=49369 RepID=UPI000F60E154|nr:calmodulin-binding transcription activator 1-like [Coffea eugenioides]
MAGSGSQNLGFRLDIKQILSEAQHRWLRPAEICEILRNYQKFYITPEPPVKPASGSVFLFDRKVLRYFRKDGHNWRKKKDGKTVKEAHEKLKVGSVDMLHCYYAHGEENENFQRRSYWMLEQDLMHIVFVHYLEVKGNKANIQCLKDAGTVSSNSQDDSSLSFGSPANSDRLASPYTDMTSPTSTLTSACEDAESEINHPASSRFHPYLETTQEDFRGLENLDAGFSSSYNVLQSLGGQPTSSASVHDGCTVDHPKSNFVPGVERTLDSASWEEVLGQCTTGMVGDGHKSWNAPAHQANWQGDCLSPMQGVPLSQNLIPDSAYYGKGSLWEQKSISALLQSAADPFYMRPDGQEDEAVERDVQKLRQNVEAGYMMSYKAETSMPSAGSGNCSLVLKQPHLSGIQAEESLKKVDSFSRWMAKELGEVEELPLHSTNGYSWSVIQTEDVVGDSCTPTQLQLDADTLNFSLSQDQLFSITDFSPNWAYSRLETKVLITGRFLKSGQEFTRYKWSCMFGELEVPAEVLSGGVLCCHAPPHKAGLVPFYVTCSNRLACSEVREFEYRAGPSQEIDFADIPGSDAIEVHLQRRLEKLFLTGPIGSTQSVSETITDKKEVVNKIFLLMEAEYNQMATLSPRDVSPPNGIEEQHGEKLLKEKFYTWLIQKVTEGGKGPSLLDDEGQGVLHLAAALGFNWAIKPVIISGISIDFRDVNGWTALHWAALCGREDTVAVLVSLGAAPGALTDPSAEHPLARTPADLASANGHKGIAGFLAECSLTTHLSTLTVKDSKDDDTLQYSEAKAIKTVSERVASPITEQDVPDSLSLKDSMAAVCNATQAAARIHQIFRIQSFQRKQLDIQHINESSSMDEHTLSLIAAKTSRLGKNDWTAHGAAISIQKKFRGWKKRKEFLIIRQRIVKIQAHVRGHQVRKKYKTIIWSVGILEKVILRWRRKGSGLRGFRPDAVAKCPSAENMPRKDDDYDFLKEGRKQTEERLQKALSRVKSMAQYPEARAQYRRLLTVAEGFRETEDTSNPTLSGSEDVSYADEELFDVEKLSDHDTFMSMAFE